MDWNMLLKPCRLGYEGEEIKKNNDRSVFQSDYDRIIFLAAFRRLQRKTQVIPFPETDVIHTRLTHSLEAASVGRSLGTIVGNNLNINGIEAWELGSLVSTASLSHDIGNPPLGHSGEKAIAEFFESPRGMEIMDGLTEKQKFDFSNFEGNAMGFHLITYSNPKLTIITGGQNLTYPTLATFTKYPRAFMKNPNETLISEKKAGLFSCDFDIYKKIALELGIPLKDNGEAWVRHPLAFLTEAADDICYRIIDLEDGYKHGLISYNDVLDCLIQIFDNNPKKDSLDNLKKLLDNKTRIGYLRAKSINSLIYQVADIFMKKEQELLKGEFDKPLCELIPSYKLLEKIKTIVEEKIYRYKPVLQIEAAGFQVLPGLLDTFLSSVMNSKKHSSKKILSLIPDEYILDYKNYKYDTILSITSYVAGMTDDYAIDTYRNLKGIQLPNC